MITCEISMLEVYRHFNCIKGSYLPTNNLLAVMDMYIPSNCDIIQTIKHLIEKDFITKNLQLTEKGEEAIYGRFCMDTALQNIKRFFQYYQLKVGQCLIQQWSATKGREYLNALEYSKIGDIVNHLIDHEYLDKSLCITKKGETFIWE